MTEENTTYNESSWGIEYAPNMTMYSFDIFGEEERKIVDNAFNTAEKLCPRKFKSAYFVYICQKFIEFYEREQLES